MRPLTSSPPMNFRIFLHLAWLMLTQGSTQEQIGDAQTKCAKKRSEAARVSQFERGATRRFRLLHSHFCSHVRCSWPLFFLFGAANFLTPAFYPRPSLHSSGRDLPAHDTTRCLAVTATSQWIRLLVHKTHTQQNSHRGHKYTHTVRSGHRALRTHSHIAAF